MAWLGNNPAGLLVLELHLHLAVLRRVAYLDHSVARIRFVTYRTVEATPITSLGVQTAPTQIRSVTKFAVGPPYLGAL